MRTISDGRAQGVRDPAALRRQLFLSYDQHISVLAILDMSFSSDESLRVGYFRSMHLLPSVIPGEGNAPKLDVLSTSGKLEAGSIESENLFSRRAHSDPRSY